MSVKSTTPKSSSKKKKEDKVNVLNQSLEVSSMGRGKKRLRDSESEKNVSLEASIPMNENHVMPTTKRARVQSKTVEAGFSLFVGNIFGSANSFYHHLSSRLNSTATLRFPWFS